jgi:hypothetical protein
VSTEEQTEQRSEDESRDEEKQDESSGGESAEDLAQKKEREREEAKEEIEGLENGELPGDLSEWPSGPAKYETFGMDDDAYGDGATAKLGPPNLERHRDGSVSVNGKKVDNPDDYKGEPIAGGLPTDD